MPTCRVYLDHNASHPLLNDIRKEYARMITDHDEVLSNPASIHLPGQKAKKTLYRLKSMR